MATTSARFAVSPHRIVNAVQEEMGDELQFVFRHFPITTLHPHAELAAEAAEAAGAQELF